MDRSEQSKLTVGSLLGVPLGAEPPGTPWVCPKVGSSAIETETTSSETAAPSAPASSGPTSMTTEEQAWTVFGGDLRPPRGAASFRADGVEAVTYDNPFGQPVEQVWFDSKLVYALDVGEVDVDPNLVKVAQEYQIVYAVELDENGKSKAEPERVPDQLNIYDSVPGMEKYSPIWQFNYVVVPHDYQPNTLRSERDCLASGYTIHRSQDFEN